MPTQVGNVNFPYSIGNEWDYQNQAGQASDTSSTSDGSGFDFGSLLNNQGVSSLAESNPYTGIPFALAQLGDLFAKGDYGAGAGFLLGGPIGEMIGNMLFPMGVPKGAKTAGAAASLEQSGDPLSGLLGQLMGNLGGGKDSNVLSNPAFARETNTGADILSWLIGQGFPGYKKMGTTGEIAGIPAPQGGGYTKPVNIMGVQSPEQLLAELGKSPNLLPGEVEALMPQIQQLIGGGGTLASLKPALAGLAKSATPSAAPAGGAPMATGGAGNYVDSGQNDELQNMIQRLMAQNKGGGGTSPWD